MGCGANFKDSHSVEALKNVAVSSENRGTNCLMMVPVCSGDLGDESVADPGARTERYTCSSEPILSIPDAHDEVSPKAPHPAPCLA
jgi:hypothetical protein